MLPDFTVVALYEPSGGIFGESGGIWISLGAAPARVTARERESRVFLIATNASRHLFFAFILDIIVDCECGFIFDGVLTSL